MSASVWAWTASRTCASTSSPVRVVVVVVFWVSCWCFMVVLSWHPFATYCTAVLVVGVREPEQFALARIRTVVVPVGWPYGNQHPQHTHTRGHRVHHPQNSNPGNHHHQGDTVWGRLLRPASQGCGAVFCPISLG